MSDVRKKLIGAAFSNQRELNHRLDPDWASQGWKYYRAIWREAAEVFDHLNWEWWSKGKYNQPPSPEQLKEVHVELCDILHFGLSLDIIKAIDGGRSTNERAQDYIYAYEAAESSTEPLDVAMENLMIDALLIREFNIKKFARACKAAKLSFTGLMAYYFGKTALNQFRWDNGYNLPKGDPAKYVKMWHLPGMQDPQEDNVFLSKAMEKVIGDIGMPKLESSIHEGGYVIAVYAELELMYRQRQ